jgi:ribosomal protein S18 acetylase RimI-like enzyme
LPFLLDPQGDIFEPELVEQLLFSTLRLREATKADLPAIAGLIHAAFEEQRGRLAPPSGAHNETVETLEEKLRAGGAILAKEAGQAAGCVFYRPEAGCIYLERLAVLPRFRRRGIAHALIEAVEERARASGLPCVRLGVRADLAENQDYYERLGFHRVEAAAHTGYSQTTYYIYKKELV